MSRNKELEALLQAQYDWEGAWPQEKAAYQEKFDRLVRHFARRFNGTAAARGKRLITETELREAIGERYFQFKKARDRELSKRLTP